MSIVAARAGEVVSVGNGHRAHLRVPEFDHAIRSHSVSLDHLIDALTMKRVSHDGERRAAYDQYFSSMLQAYQHDGVLVEDSFFCKRIQGGALLTKRSTKNHRHSEETYRIHIRYPTESVLAVTPEFAQVVWRCISLSKRATQLLRTQNSIAIHKSMYSMVVYLLSVLDTVQMDGHTPTGVRGVDADRGQRIRIALQEAHEQLTVAENQFEASTRWASNFAYVNGMLLGLALLGIIGLTAFNVLTRTTNLTTFLAVAYAGCAGAVVSVMTRMSSESFHIDSLAEHRAVWMLGVFRPLLGAVFGAALFVAVAGGLVDVVPASVEASASTRVFYFSALGFVAGFNERFATGVLSGIETKSNPVK